MTNETVATKFFKFCTSYILSIPIFILLAPFAKIYDFVTLSSFFAGRNSKGNHIRKVRDVQKQVKAWEKNGRKNRMCTGRKAWKTLSVHNMKKSNYTRIDVDLNDIVEIDEKNQMLTVEPGMMMGQLSNILLTQGWTIGVIPEFETLTVGGCICGTGIETTSNKYGLFNEICTEYEVVTANGDIVNCSKDENADLFYSIPWSHGTIGFLTAVKIPLIRARKYVKLEYYPKNSVSEAKKLLSTEGNDFVEGIMFGKNRVVVMFGNYTDKVEPGRVNNINRWYKPWFFKHVESYLDRSPKNGPFIEYIPLRDYYHRHTRGFFWETKYLLPFGNNVLIRYLFGWLYPLNFQLLKLLFPLRTWEAYYVLNHVLQDFMVPMHKLESSLDFIHNTVEVYPLWLCPCKYFKRPGMVQPRGNSDEMFIDIGIYGDTLKIEQFDPETTTRRIEKFALENNGFQFLYADCYLTNEDFEKMFDMKLYNKVRAQYNCNDAFPDVYDKISKHARRLASAV